MVISGKKFGISRGDIILVGLRDYQDNKCDIFYKYTPDEARRLKNKDFIPKNIVIGLEAEATVDNGDQYVDFDEISDHSSETE